MVLKFEKQYLYIQSLTLDVKNPLSGNMITRLRMYKALLLKFKAPFIQQVFS